VSIDFGCNKKAGQAGILFRCSGVSLGFNAQRGYYAGLFPRDQVLILGKMDGEKWIELEQVKASISVDTPQRLRVRVSADEFTVFLNGRRALSVNDSSYTSGFAGLRVLNTHALFSYFVIDLLGSDLLVL